MPEEILKRVSCFLAGSRCAPHASCVQETEASGPRTDIGKGRPETVPGLLEASRDPRDPARSRYRISLTRATIALASGTSTTRG